MTLVSPSPLQVSVAQNVCTSPELQPGACPCSLALSHFEHLWGSRV